jgi:hypothetical protein
MLPSARISVGTMSKATKAKTFPDITSSLGEVNDRGLKEKTRPPNAFCRYSEIFATIATKSDGFAIRVPLTGPIPSN